MELCRWIASGFLYMIIVVQKTVKHFSKIGDLYSDSDQSEIDTKNDDEIIEDMEQAAVDMKRDVEFDKTDEDKESDK